MQLAAAVVRMPPVVEVVVGTRAVVRPQRRRQACRVAVNAVVVVLVAAVPGEPAVADDEQPVDVAITAALDLGVDAVEHRTAQSDVGGHRDGPAVARHYLRLGVRQRHRDEKRGNDDAGYDGGSHGCSLALLRYVISSFLELC